jgi:hypothetical protein
VSSLKGTRFHIPFDICVCRGARRHLRSVSVDLQGVDAVLGEAAALQEGAVVAQLHALAGEVTGLEQLNAVVLTVLREYMLKLEKHRTKPHNLSRQGPAITRMYVLTTFETTLD